MDATTLLANMRDKLPALIFIGIRVIFIAIVFEFIAWYLGRRIEAATSPLMNADAGRDAAWRTRRRTLLRRMPKIISRTLCYAVALILVFDAFQVPVLPLSLALGAVALLFGAALIPQMRDIAQGYVLLGEDAVAPGDLIEANGHTGVVEKWTPRGVWLRDREGKTHLLSHRDLSSFIIHARRAETPQDKDDAPRTMNYDPLAAPAKPVRNGAGKEGAKTK